MAIHLTMTELEAGAAEFGVSPQDGGTLEMIVCRPQPEQRQVLDHAELDTVIGLVGDCWKARGSSSTPDGSAHPDAQIALMNSRVIHTLTRDRSEWAWAGDQLYVDLDLSPENLPPGQRISIGTAILEITSMPHNGCAKFTARFGHDAIRYVNSPEGKAQRRRGIFARVIQPGTIRTGDKIEKIAETVIS